MAHENLLTIDFEDWASSSLSLLSDKEARVARQSLSERDEQLVRGVRRLLEMLAKSDACATFFVLAGIANAYKELLREIAGLDHEIASHAMTHTPLTELDAARLDFELRASKELLEDIVGARVRGFRAPHLSGLPRAVSFGEKLHRAGYDYDSSYRDDALPPEIRDAWPCVLGQNAEEAPAEFPVTTARRWIARMPLGGTGLKMIGACGASEAIRRENDTGRSAVIYIHPYEIDAEPVRWPHRNPSPAARLSLFLRNFRKESGERILAQLLAGHRFTSISALALPKN